MVDLSNYTVDELKTIREQVADEIKARNAEEQERAKALKAERAETFTGNINAGDKIRFLYNRDEREGVVDRANPKSVTVTFEDGKKHYISYENVAEILERAPVVEADEAEDEAEKTEEVAQ